MTTRISRRQALGALAGTLGSGAMLGRFARHAHADRLEPRWEKSIDSGLKWLASQQTTRGHWTVSNYPTAMAALAGTALLCSGSTTTQGPYARNIRRAIDYLVTMARPNGLIGDPLNDNRYTYGHGFSMLFLSQVLGEEEDIDRRDELFDILGKAVKFSGQAQTKSGGWGYVSAKDGNDFDEGSTTVTQVQGLRGCRNAGIPVPAEVIEEARQYIYQCKNADGGISYSSRNRGSSRPAITAAALATLYNAGEYKGNVVEEMSKFCRDKLYKVTDGAHAYGHWHYTYLYYAQVVYREGGQEPGVWPKFRKELYDKIVSSQNDGHWQGNIGPVYVTSCNLIMLQLDRGYLPIYQR